MWIEWKQSETWNHHRIICGGSLNGKCLDCGAQVNLRLGTLIPTVNTWWLLPSKPRTSLGRLADVPLYIHPTSPPTSKRRRCVDTFGRLFDIIAERPLDIPFNIRATSRIYIQHTFTYASHKRLARKHNWRHMPEKPHATLNHTRNRAPCTQIFHGIVHVYFSPVYTACSTSIHHQTVALDLFFNGMILFTLESQRSTITGNVGVKQKLRNKLTVLRVQGISKTGYCGCNRTRW